MSSDASGVSSLFDIFHLLWSTPFQIILSLYLLYRTIGVSAVGGFVVMAISIPLNISLSRKARNSNKKVIKSKDSRIKFIAELIANIKLVKLFSWEIPMLDKISNVRNNMELPALREYGYLGSIVFFVLSITPNLVSLSTLAIYAFFDNESRGPLNTQLIFVTLSLLNNLRFSLTRAPMILSSVIEILYSVERLESFFNEPEFDKDAVIYENRNVNPDPSNNNSSSQISTEATGLLENATYKQSSDFNSSLAHNPNQEYSIIMEHAKFFWDNETEFKLDVNIRLGKNECVGIVGSIGSGKSSFISAIVGEMNKESGKAIINGSIAYSPQTPWIMNATLRENIVFGNAFDKDFYDLVVEACELQLDISFMPAGDFTEIGERGVTLSGGQKARVSLARAVYSRPDIILLDDTLSALDVTVGKRIFQKVIGPNGIMKGSTRIVVTHSMQYISDFDRILIMKNGKIAANGKHSIQIDSILREMNFLNSGDIFSSNTSECFGMETNEQKSSKKVLIEKNLQAPTSSKRSKLLTVEESQTSRVSRSTYILFLKSCGFKNVALATFLLLMASANGILSNFTLKYWADSNDDDLPHKKISPAVFLAIYAFFGFLGALSTSLLSFTIRAVCAINSAKKTHSMMLSGIINSPMSFFYTTPIGRIINRFSSDQSIIDQMLPRNFLSWSTAIMSAVSSILVICLSFPVFIILAVPLIIAYLMVQEYYLQTSRQLKRISSILLSPIYSHFTESVVGISTIRSFKQQDRFEAENQDKLNKYLSASLTYDSLSQWESLRIEGLGSVIVLMSTLLGVIYIQLFGTIDASLAALSIVYSLQFTNALSRSVGTYCSIETNLISVERVYEYINLPSEFEDTPELLESKAENFKLGEDWPEIGNLNVDNLVVRYFKNTEPALKGVSLQIKGGEKIGVVGRTGSGKSTLASSLFRLIEPEEGKIFIDEVNTRSIELLNLRKNISIIPQESILVSGTLRYNLDPNDVYSDDELWRAIELVNLKEVVGSKSLEMMVLNDGANFSAGQKQLVCLARVILKRSKVLILDEATASVDLATEAIILSTIDKEFSDCTVITIAHRLETVVNCDKILYFDDGKVVESGSPSELLKNKDSRFYTLYNGL
ncbi:Canalicular multispecific organic anion transporter 1 [Smittium mucronatum]|uniref:Canalicular multispecific organic anion transporter 1 n=1 Tax=Smittium mucronatum TaxID=133383 RepID=A0A1R0H152_9FUNG|nr:Canalicular multispecific organic anion transporter 1 [Smittium mucronatum]OLY82872.1 Canalicular multispecific organic anion transporter 1 [Smittium mucronatum]